MIHNRYVLHQQIGEGGYSKVYKCTDELGIRYVCKILPKKENTRARVQNEIEMLKRLHPSPKVVRMYDAGENSEAYYIIQEWCRGGNVRDYVTEFDLYVENTVASIVRGVLRGLVHLHESNVLHCDIKPGNIFLGDKSEDADVKIGDFGTALLFYHKKPDELIPVDTLVGTPWFLAPENLSYTYHETSDIWSLGVMTYQLLTGRMPFNDTEMPFQPRIPVIWKRILMSEPQMTGKRWNSISSNAKEFIQMCLVKDYRQRPSARTCLEHPWLTQSDCNDRFKGVPLTCQPFMYESNTMMKAKTL